MSEPVNPWHEYRKRRNLAIFAFLGYVPIVFLIALAGLHLLQSMTPGFVAAVGWMIFAWVAGFRVERFKCPRCGKCFFAKWWYHNAFARRCLHCKLPKYAVPESDRSAPPLPIT